MNEWLNTMRAVTYSTTVALHKPHYSYCIQVGISQVSIQTVCTHTYYSPTLKNVKLEQLQFISVLLPIRITEDSVLYGKENGLQQQSVLHVSDSFPCVQILQTKLLIRYQKYMIVKRNS